MNFFKNKKGFTLVELVVVIAILGILAGIAIPRFMDATASARGAKIVADLRTIDSACMMHYAKYGTVATKALITTTTAGTSSQLIASWPTPPKGKATITNNAGTALEWTVGDATYDVATVNGAERGVIGTTTTIDTLLTATTGGSLPATK